MFEFSINKKPLEDAIKLAILSTENSENLITGHSLFSIEGQTLKVFSTDKKSRIAKAVLPATATEDFKFTTDPRKILKLIQTTDGDILKFGYTPETMTTQVYLSDDKEAFVALPSFDPATYTPIEENFDKAYDLKTINANVFLGGIQFIKGFLVDKHPKFSNMFITSGIMYGANGHNKAAAFSSLDLEGLDELVFPMITFPAITSLINTLNMQDIVLSTSSNYIFMSTVNKDFSYGFTKVQMKMPKIPISIEEPAWDSWALNKTTLLKKLSRLHLTGGADLGVKLTFGDRITMATCIDRPSKDTLDCIRLKGSSEITRITEVRLLEAALKQFGASELNFFIDRKIVLHSKANIAYTENGQNILKPFICTAAIAISQEE